MSRDFRNLFQDQSSPETTAARGKLRTALMVVGVLALIALVAGIVTGNYQPLALIVAIVAIVVVSWLWSVLVDRLFHKLRHWNKSQAPQPVVLDRKPSVQQYRHPLKFSNTGRTAYTVANLMKSGLLTPFYTGESSEDPDERMSSLKLQIAENLRLLGRELRDTGRASEADDAMAEARAIDPYGDPDGNAAGEKYQNPLFRAVGLMRTGSYEEAVGELSGKGRARKSASALYSLGLCQALAGDLDKAVDTLVDAANAGAESSMLRTAIGAIYVQQDKLDDAGKQFRAAVAMDEENAGAMAGLGTVLLRSEKPDAARTYLDEALSQYANFMPARFGYAYLLWSNSDPAGAAREFNRIRQSFDLEGDEALVIQHNIAACYLATGQHSEVITLLEDSAEAGPETRRILVDAYDQSGQQEKSRKLLSEIGSGEGAEDLHLRVIQSLREDGKLDEAENELNRLISNGKTPPSLLAEKGAILEARGDVGGAEKAYSEAVSKDKECVAAAKGLGRILLDKGQPKEAVNRLKAVTTSSDADVDTFFLLGKAHLMNGKALLALEALKDASLRSGGKRGDVTWELGKALLEAGRARDAAEELRKARKLLPAEPEIERDLGYANYKTRNYKDAVRNLQAYLQSKPDASDSAEVQNLVNKLSTN